MRLVFLLSVIMISCTNDPKLVQEFVSDKEQAIEQVLGAELLHTENGKVKVKVIAGKIERFANRQPQLVFSEGLKVLFYKDSLNLQSTLLADNASMDEEKNIMLARNNVELISNDNKKLETEELIWDEKKNKIYTEKKVKITTGKEVVFGEGFVSTPDFTEYSIKKINGTFDFDPKSN